VIGTWEAFSGPWAANARGWLWTALPVSLLVVTQEVATNYPSWWWIVASALLQLVGSAAWGVLVAGLARALTGRVPLVVSLILWVGHGLVRGSIGALVATAAGVPPDWTFRLVFWVAVSLTWTPLLTYTMAQLDERRRLLARQQALGRSLSHAEERHRESVATQARRLAEAADSAFRPALDEVRAQLRGMSGALDSATLRSFGRRLETLATHVAGYQVAPVAILEASTRQRVSMSEATSNFEIRRPLFASALTALASAPLVLPDAIREGGLPQATETALAVVASALAFAAFLALLSRMSASVVRAVLARMSGLLAGGLGAAILALGSWHELHPHDLIIVAIFPVLMAAAAGTLATAVALEATNAELDSDVATDRARLDQRQGELRRDSAEATRRVLTLIRGDLNGRLASCAMAFARLNDGGLNAQAQASIVAEVLRQLDAAAIELSGAVAK